MSDSSADGANERTAFGDMADDWNALVEVSIETGRRALDRASERARDNMSLIRERQYGVESLLDDVRWFWSGVAEDTSALVSGFKDRRPPG